MFAALIWKQKGSPRGRFTKILPKRKHIKNKHGFEQRIPMRGDIIPTGFKVPKTTKKQSKKKDSQSGGQARLRCSIWVGKRRGNESRDWGTHCYWQRRENRRIGNSDGGETQNLLGMPGFQNLWKLWWVQFGFKGVPTVIFRLKKAISIDQFRFIQYFDFTRKSTRNGKEQESVNGCQVKGLRM